MRRLFQFKKMVMEKKDKKRKTIFFFHERHLTNCVEERRKKKMSDLKKLFFLKNKKIKRGVNYIMRIDEKLPKRKICENSFTFFFVFRVKFCFSRIESIDDDNMSVRWRTDRQR
jgi:hypothetical protein